MKKAYLSIVPIIGTILSSCNTQNNQKIREEYFTDNALVYDMPSQKADTLRGEILIPDMVGPYALVVADSLICLSNMAQEPAFMIYNLNGQHLSDIGLYGQGPNDFLTNMSNGQIIKKNGETSLLIVDVNAGALKQLNLTKSLKENTAVVDSVYPFTFMEKFAGLSGDRLIEEGRCKGNYELLVKSTDDYTLLHKEKFYNIDTDDNDPILYWSSMSISPNGQYLVMGLYSLNEINIMDLHDFSRLSVSIGNVKAYEELRDRKQSSPDWQYYTKVSLSDDYIYALYTNEPWSENDITSNNHELHIIGYDGTLKLIAPFDRRIRSISYSPIDNKIYALDFDDNVFKYPLPQFEK
ncbi:MAG: hypothetical protein HDS35_01650 [Bacteroides sp.]|nr:hypothetical protein [Bacteroides sp.]